MLRLLKCLIFAVGGAFIGGCIGTMIGMAYMEFAQHGCTGTVCADLIVRTFIPGGALAGGMVGLIMARPRERLSRF
ncbi:hypothetical protein [Methylocella sp. CPCC 101449]|uniref:hypothetical protein n=1 Tax=Methylocella sp. CPCC 101449 TaxID=2987531 RepID=UPI00288D3A3B|nr:hypothetical protein [Methylocella sp. CPCC 101449]MDT2020883.1 hypothetical protein [Methylocella sp. CPCC 101449]HEV2570863.1 hypothetical protein [Beijerinckiaceae bacterium]